MWDRSVSRSDNHYRTLTLEDIQNLPVEEFMADDSYCWLWIPNNQLLHGLGEVVLSAWGYRPITTFAWCKNGLGLGYYIRNTHENIAFGVRGSPGRFNIGNFRSWENWPSGEHSSKPDPLYDRVMEACDGPYLELFAREEREGWTTWGDELEDTLGIGFDPDEW